MGCGSENGSIRYHVPPFSLYFTDTVHCTVLCTATLYTVQLYTVPVQVHDMYR